MLLGFLFFCVALAYASVGFGGGSTYNALLVLGGVDYTILPIISLICNITVVSGGVWHFSRVGHLPIKKVLPWIMISVPAAWVGGYIEVPKDVFVALLGIVLFGSGIRMLCPEKETPTQYRNVPSYIPFGIGGMLGFIAGITGIGGGIFLAPILHLLKWDNARNIAGTCSLFILVNSLAGLCGQIIKLGHTNVWDPVSTYWFLFPAVFVGGQIGSRLGSSFINILIMKKVTAVLILYVAVRHLLMLY